MKIRNQVLIICRLSLGGMLLGVLNSCALPANSNSARQIQAARDKLNMTFKQAASEGEYLMKLRLIDGEPKIHTDVMTIIKSIGDSTSAKYISELHLHRDVSCSRWVINTTFMRMEGFTATAQSIDELSGEYDSYLSLQQQ